MTNREFLNAIASTETIADELREHAAAALVKLDEANAKRKEKAAEKPSKKAEENAPLVIEAVASLGTDTKVAADVAEAMGISVQKASYLLRTAVAEGKATVEDIKVPGKGTVKGYTAVIAE